MTPTIHATEPHRCPLCGQPNQCAMEIERQSGIKQEPCWCSTEKISQAVLDQIPATDLGRACVCAACVKAGTTT